MLVRAGGRQPPVPVSARVFRVAACLLAIALINEGLQRFVPPRTPEVGDVVADTVGGAIGAWLAARKLRAER